MALIAVSKSEFWFSSGWVFRLVLDRVKTRLSDAEDLEDLKYDFELKSMYLDDKPGERAERIGRALREASVELQADLQSGSLTTAANAELADMLRTLESYVQRFA